VAASIADVVREQLLSDGRSFAFETVMSHASKADFLKRACEEGYLTYLYFIATDSPCINEYRGKTRRLEGQHEVPRDKTYERYYRSLDLLPRAIESSYRAYFFDSSGTAPVWLAERTPLGALNLKVARSQSPEWYLSHVEN
jgi:predicted ABC-type ATPase